MSSKITFYLLLSLTLTVSFKSVMHYRQSALYKLRSNGVENEISNNLPTSPNIVKLQNKIKELEKSIDEVREERFEVEATITKLDKEYGDEISRIKREFARMKERAFEEATAVASKAKVDAIKEILPVTDNYFRARGIYEPLISTAQETAILASYESTFLSLQKVLEDFGLTRVQALGQPFDFRYMEAIMTEPSYEYAADLVTKEYQVGYRMGELSVRPSMVVVSVGPGP